MMRSLYSGVAGLKTHQTKMDVIGNNIANVNTIGFKSSAVTFSDIMYQTTSGASGATETVGGKNAKQIGLGVTTAATKISITSAGAAQSTGQAFDIKLTDSNTTNFFVVNNGSENLFTRAGSFYLDGNGNLAMASTGYMVMGWQAEETEDAGVTIRQSTVSPLRIMQPKNLTSAPEATTEATFSGVIDKNEKNVTSEEGYYRNLSFFDNLGYSYTARFSIKAADTENGEYTVELTNIYNDQNQDILATYEANGGELSSIFGKDTQATRRYNPTKNFSVESGNIYFTSGGNQYRLDASSVPASITVPETEGNQTSFTFVNSADTTDTRTVDLATLFSIDTTSLDPGTLALSETGQMEYTYDTTNYNLKFNTDDGTFSYINTVGDNGKVSMNLSALNDLGNFEDINIDFTKLLNYDNGGSSTVNVEKGDINGVVGIGKKLGALTSVSVDGSGKIFGSYDNGNTVLLGQIAVAQFSNASGLESLGNSCYKTTLNSGDFDGIGVDVTADGGSMSTGQLEMSNVDLSQEFTDMITTQRGFQANSRIITVSDTMLEELTNLKR
ncbi:MAG: flagellar hook-basal body complex protein [Lachnospiraceae bacterium]|nr:flagellar hook-basal body complex protein [Lachnospiraceae bacterium]